jgi:hypothetical protein
MTANCLGVMVSLHTADYRLAWYWGHREITTINLF